MYVDESGIDVNMCKEKGWGKKGHPILGKTSGKRYERINIVSGLNNNKTIAPLTFKGKCNTVMFNGWVEQQLIKELKPGQIVIMDNASFHKSSKTKELIESVGCKLMFLPPYSPDLNPIEKFWANMKRYLKSKIERIEGLSDAIMNFFLVANSG